MFSFGYSFFLSGPIIGYTSLSYFYIFSIVFYMIHYFDTIAKHPFLVALQILKQFFCYILFGSEVGQVLLLFKKREDFLICFCILNYLFISL